jgi:hypothetical protein
MVDTSQGINFKLEIGMKLHKTVIKNLNPCKTLWCKTKLDIEHDGWTTSLYEGRKWIQEHEKMKWCQITISCQDHGSDKKKVIGKI